MTKRLIPPIRLRVGERVVFAGRWHGPFARPRAAIEAMRRANLEAVGR